MKNGLLALALVFSSFQLLFPASGTVSGNVTNLNPAVYPPGLLVSVSFYTGNSLAPATLVLNDTTRTDSTGFYSLPFSFTTTAGWGTVISEIIDCRSNVMLDSAIWANAGVTNAVINLDFCRGSTSCSASFTASLSSGRTYNFVNTSTNTPSTIYAWDFGDLNSSALQSPQHTYSSDGSYTVCLTITDTITSCTSVFCDTIVVSTVPSCFADFTFSISGNTVNFTSLSSQPNHFWDFGDGTASTTINPSHSYFNTGNYQVCLTVTDSNCIDSICKNVMVNSSNLSISGSVTANFATPFAGIVYLIASTPDTTLGVIDSLSIGNVTGNLFSFNVVPGTYYLKAALLPIDSAYNAFIPTYYNSTLSWTTSTALVVIGSSLTGKDINLIQGINPGGPGFIGGKVSQGANKIAGPGDPHPNASVILTQSGNGVAHTVTDTNGNYGFNNLAYGTYQLFVEIIGKTPYYRTVTINADNEREEEANFIVRKNGVTTSVELLEELSLVKLHPNPVSSTFQLSLYSTVGALISLEILDLGGRMVKHESYKLNPGIQEFPMAVDELQNGYYLVVIRHGSQRIVERFIKN